MFKKKDIPTFAIDWTKGSRVTSGYRYGRLKEFGLAGDVTALAVDPVGGWLAAGACLDETLQLVKISSSPYTLRTWGGIPLQRRIVERESRPVSRLAVRLTTSETIASSRIACRCLT